MKKKIKTNYILTLGLLLSFCSPALGMLEMLVKFSTGNMQKYYPCDYVFTENKTIKRNVPQKIYKSQQNNIQPISYKKRCCSKEKFKRMFLSFINYLKDPFNCESDYDKEK